MKDIGRLQKKTITDKNGRKRTVYVSMNQDAPTTRSKSPQEQKTERVKTNASGSRDKVKQVHDSEEASVSKKKEAGKNEENKKRNKVSGFLHKQRSKYNFSDTELKAKTKIGQLLEKKKIAVIKQIKEEIHEVKEAGHAIKKILTGKRKELTKHEVKALKAVAIHAVLVIASSAAMGGFSHGLAKIPVKLALSYLKHVGILRGGHALAFAKGENMERAIKDYINSNWILKADEESDDPSSEGDVNIDDMLDKFLSGFIKYIKGDYLGKSKNDKDE